ncbi:hypothetical protein B0H14DRAFT_2621758 [Mycena olivaceomarginata]|nr:hypothetical protein B0H14DRAFT_2621758 [Mycena olivaceomarginata]
MRQQLTQRKGYKGLGREKRRNSWIAQADGRRENEEQATLMEKATNIPASPAFLPHLHTKAVPVVFDRHLSADLHNYRKLLLAMFTACSFCFGFNCDIHIFVNVAARRSGGSCIPISASSQGH